MTGHRPTDVQFSFKRASPRRRRSVAYRGGTAPGGMSTCCRSFPRFVLKLMTFLDRTPRVPCALPSTSDLPMPCLALWKQDPFWRPLGSGAWGKCLPRPLVTPQTTIDRTKSNRRTQTTGYTPAGLITSPMTNSRRSGQSSRRSSTSSHS